jgi:putative ABC transport system permease protein
MQQSRWFRRLLRLLPADFQADYARDMERTFTAQHREARAHGGVARLWLETMSDLLRTAPREHAAQLARDVRYALRHLVARPVATFAATATLAIGIGSATAILSIANGVDWRPLAYVDPDAVVFVKEQVNGAPSATTGFSTFADWRERSRSFAELAAIASMNTTITGETEPEQASVMRVTPGYFRVIGREPLIGRAFSDAENRWDNRRFVVLGERIWRRRFASDPGVVGRAVQLGGRPYVVTGVMAAARGDVIAEGLYDGADLWVPLAYDPSLPFACRTCRHVRVVGRLRPDVTIEHAQAEIDAITVQLGREHAGQYATPGGRVERVSDAMLAPVRPALYLLLAAVGVLLLIAGLNVANLLLVRAVERGPEIATRRALGVATGRLVRQLLTESFVLAALGAAAGVALGTVALRALVAAAPASVPRIAEVTLDGRVLAMTLLATAVVGLLFGLLPTLQLASADVVAALRGARSATAGGRLGRALVAGNVALALVLLAVTALLGRSFVRLLDVDPGIDPSNVTTVSLSLAGPAYAEPGASHAFYRRLLERLSRPGDVVAITTQLPAGERNDRAGLHVDGRATGNPEAAPSAHRFAVTADYFRALRIPVLRGRPFTRDDTARSQPVAIVGAATARYLFGDGNPLGRAIALGPADGPRRVIVGVVGDVRHEGLSEAAPLQAYLPLEQFYDSPVRVVLRSDDSTAEAAARIRAAVAEIDRTQALSSIRTYDEVLESTLAERRFLLGLIGAFAAAALLLAVIGLYGLVSYVVLQRRRDIGLRVALGADGADIRRLVLRIGMSPVVVGIAVGLGLLPLVTRPIESMLFSVDRLDPRALGGAVALLASSALAACYLPARRATHVDPIAALRTD